MNCIDDQGAKELSVILREGKLQLSSLNLFGVLCHLSEKMASIFCSFLECLTGNRVFKNGVNDICGALKTNTALNVLDLGS